MLSAQELRRYSKQTILPEIGIRGQEALKNAKVLVVGAGGLGCPILQYLTAAGVGTIGIADGDEIDVTNLQRQVLYTEFELGQRKATVATNKLSALNPNVKFSVFPFFITVDNALKTLSDYDIIVDGSDNFATRYLVNDACVILNKPMVSGAIYKYEGQVSVFNYNNGPTYRCIFPEPPDPEESPNCAEIGVIASLPGIVGTIQANEVIKIITGVGEVLSGRLLVMDTLTMQTHFFSFRLNPANKQMQSLSAIGDYCAPSVIELSYDDVKTMLENYPSTQLIDVREKEEHEINNIGGINIPLSRLGLASDKLSPERNVVLYCSSGVRSRQFGKQLLQKGYSKIFSLKNGISGLEAY